MRSPFTVTPALCPETSARVFRLERDDGAPVAYDGELAILAVNYATEDAAVDALQTLSRAYYREAVTARVAGK